MQMLKLDFMHTVQSVIHFVSLSSIHHKWKLCERSLEWKTWSSYRQLENPLILFANCLSTVFDKTKIVTRDSQLRDHSLLKEWGWLARMRVCVERGGGGARLTRKTQREVHYEVHKQMWRRGHLIYCILFFWMIKIHLKPFFSQWTKQLLGV